MFNDLLKPAVLLVAVMIMNACGGMAADAPSAKNSSAKVTLELPSGVSLKPGGKMVSANRTFNAAKITSITLSVTAPDLATPVTGTIPLDTLELSLDVTSGNARTFTVTVTTDTGLSFSGAKTVDLVANSSIDLSISVTVTPPNVTIGGTLSATAAKPSGKAARQKAVGDWTGATVEVVDSTGKVIATATADAAGTFSISVAPGTNYVLRAKKGNLVMKAFLASTDSTPASVGINPRSTAVVKVIAAALGVGDIGESGVDFSAKEGTASTTASQVENSAVVADIAIAIADEIVVSYDPNAASGAIGSLGAAGNAVVTLIVGQITSGTAASVPPSAPTGVTAVAGNGQVTITWTASAGAISYRIYYGVSSGVTTATGTKVSGAASGSAITGLTNGTTYYFIVTAVNAAEESAASSTVSATPQPAVTAPGAPTGVTATAGNAQVTLSWTVASGATSYKVYRSTSVVATGTAVGTVTPTSTAGTVSFSDTGLTNGTTYYFVVTAVNAGGESSGSSQASAMPQVSAPGVPTGVSATAGNAQATVSWTAVSGATSYNVYYSATSGAGTGGTKITGHTSGNAITGFTNGTTYYFVVTAVNAGGESSASSQTSATPQVPSPGAPTGVSATAGNAQATVSWTAVSGATSYNVYYSATSGAGTGGTKITGHTSGNAITGFANGTTYYFVVTAVNAGGESAASSQTSATPQVPAPGAPTGVSATAGNAQVSVSWTAVSGATSYNVYYSTTGGAGTGGTKITGHTSGNAITGLTNGTTYYFVVTAVNAGGESSGSSQVSAMPQVPAPSAPTGVSATAGNAQATVSWTAVSGATSYNVYYSTTSGAGTGGTKITGHTSGSAITGLTNGTTHYFVVTAVNAGGESVASSQASATPVQVVVDVIATGQNTSYAMKSDGTLWGWGRNDVAQVGDGTTSSVSPFGKTTPGTTSGLTGVAAVAGGGNHTLAVKSDGTVWAWGYNFYGQVGDNTTTQRNAPVQVSGLTGITAISAGSNHSLALKNDGTVWAWGRNTESQLGDGTAVDKHYPVQVVGTGGTGTLTGITAISAGYFFNLALKNDGTVWAWGSNLMGQLGDNTLVAKNSPVQVLGAGGTGTLTGITHIAAGGYHSVALKSDGTTWAWGKNTTGQLGDTTSTNRSTPVQTTLAYTYNPKALVAGGYHTVVLLADGTVRAWGTGSNGQLGDNSGLDRWTNVLVSGLTGVTAIAAGMNHTIALKGDGTVWGFGYNWSSQAGDGTGTDRNAPVQSNTYNTASTVSAPTGLSATIPVAGSVSLTWTASAGATGYNIYWSTQPGVTPLNGTKIVAGNVTTYTQSSLTSGTRYYYVVTALDGNESVPSAPVSALP